MTYFYVNAYGKRSCYTARGRDYRGWQLKSVFRDSRFGTKGLFTTLVTVALQTKIWRSFV